ncbi:AraC family transcriptional regulator [Paenibacillus harenae]|uniref:AraC-like DNA-binding protein n=1 Tax=Paenibacillus harenae TaxID=306543 RepID=A0ABT9TXV2_PAEHA|nr:AraC family transcriptional regulator [Paenibacillus harenae]MDQ0111897.1 AraC-like DNA-binding protein [Paenibacillus harenae]
MNFLFEPVRFEDKHLSWSGRTRSEKDYPGYYHWHQCTEILFVHQGVGSIIVDQRTYELRRGMLFVFQPFQLHKIYADVAPDEPFERTILYVDPSQTEEALRPFPKRHALFHKLWQGQDIRTVFDMQEETGRLEAIFGSYGNLDARRREYDTEEITMLLLQLMGCIAAVRDGEEARATATDRGIERKSRYSEQIMQWIEAHYAEEVTLEQLAELLHLSKYYVSRVFREETGSHITDYLTVRRIKQACRLLQTTVYSVERIGMDVGYPNASYFINTFKRVVGTTPLKYRQRHMGL